MKVHINGVVLIFTLLVSGCAGFKAGPVLDDTNDSEADGIRYYETAPFLLVYSDGKGNLTSQIIMMPDTSKKMVIDLHAIAAKNESTLTFQDGMLTSSKFVVDSTVVPAKLIDTIQTLGTAAISSAFNAPQSGSTRQVPSPYLFKIVIDPEGTKLVGGAALGLDGKPLVINVSVTKEASTDSEPKAKKENSEDAKEDKGDKK